ncbi:MAG: imidazolonepropionase [Clostridiales bacterium]|jgi:imidazolonepropionase|nr:imidazolonepropionase [Clostridiales bacterium]
MMDLVIKNIRTLATPEGRSAKAGQEQGEIRFLDDAAIGIEGGKFAYIGKGGPPFCGKIEIDARGALATPGLVDSHTHLIFGGWRQKELSMKLAGASYMDILKRGGGILDTAAQTRRASKGELTMKAEKTLKQMMGFGVTAVEAKSGYGLDLETEVKQLEAARDLNISQKASVVPTYLGAHAVPLEFSSSSDYVSFILSEALPEVARLGLAEFCDVFCEPGAFSASQSRKMLVRARELGFKLKIHADELESSGGAELAAELGLISAEHLIAASDAGIKALADKKVIATILPGTSFYLGKPYARARKMIDEGVAVAVATDFNPGSCPSPNINFAMTLASIKCGMSPSEVLAAATLNGAAALCRAEESGSVEIGKRADLVLWDAPDLDYIIYRFGINLVQMTIKDGEICHQSDAFNL